MGDYNLSVELRGNASGLTAAVNEGTASLDKFDEAAQETGASLDQLSGNLQTRLDVWKKTTASVGANTEAVSALDDELQKLIRRYDPLGAKMRALQADFRALDKAAASGEIPAQFDRNVDAAFRSLKKQISDTQGLMDTAGGAVWVQTMHGLKQMGDAGEHAHGQMAKGGLATALSTAQARRELIVLGHEAMTGNFSRMPGSFMVLASRAGVTGGALMATVAPILAVAGGAAVLAAAYAKGHEEMAVMNRALALTNDYAGLTRGGMRSLAQEMASTREITVGTAKDIVTALVVSGRIGADSIGAIARLSAQYAKATGEDVGKIAPKMVALFADPAKGAEELNRQMHFLSAADQEHINHLVRIGELGQAQLLLADRMKDQLGKTRQSMGSLESAWKTLTGAASAGWDAMLGLGRDKTPEEGFADAQRNVENLRAQMARGGSVKVNPALLAAAEGRADSSAASLHDALLGAQAEELKARGIERQVKATNELEKSQTYQLKVLKDQLMALDAAPASADKARRGFELRLQMASANDAMASQVSQDALIKERAQSLYAVQKDALDRGQRDLDIALAHHLISYDDYYERLRQKRQADLANQIAVQATDLAAAQRERDRAMPGTSIRAAREAKVGDISTKIRTLQASAPDIDRDIGEQHSAAVKGMMAQGESMHIAYLEATGKTTEAAVAKFLQQHNDAIVTMINNGDAAGAEWAGKLFNVGLARARLTEIEQANNQSLAEMGEAEKRINIEQQAGLLTQYEAQRKIIELHRQEAALLTQKLGVMQEVASAPGSPSNPKTLSDIDALKTKILELQRVADKTNWTFQYGAKSALDEYVNNTASSFHSGQEAVSGSLNAIENDLTETFKTGKLTVKSFSDFAITEFYRIQSRAIIKMGVQAANDAAGGGGFFGGLLNAIGLGGGTGGAIGAGASALELDQLGVGLALVGHSGGTFGIDNMATRTVPASTFVKAPRFHSGIGPGEMPAIIQPMESVLTPGQMRQLAPAGAGGNTINAPFNVTINAPNAQTGVAEELSAMIDKKFPGLLYQHRTNIEGLLRAQRREKGRRN